MRKTTVLFCVLIASAYPATAMVTNEIPDNPIIGTWTWALPNGCMEKHTFLASGMVSGTSGSEYTEEKYSISSKPDSNGFYKLTGYTLKDTGGPDCGGSSEDHSGKEWTAYIRFSSDRTKHIECSEPNTDTCWGPYTRSDE